MKTKLITCASVVLILLLAPLESAAQNSGSHRDTFESAVTLADLQRPASLDLSRVVTSKEMSTLDVAARAQTVTPSKKRSATRVILGAAVGATAGLFAGGYIGQAIEGDSCHCDDPGLMGALIGAPIGAVVG